MSVRIRKYRSGDGRHMAGIFRAAVEQTGRRGYSKEQVRAWAENGPDAEDFVERSADGRTLLVAVDEHDNPVAYGDLEQDGHIDHLFCHPGAGRTGMGSALCDEIERLAREMKLPRLYVEASEIARPLFERKGFRVVGRRDFEVRGVPIHNYAMEKVLG